MLFRPHSALLLGFLLFALPGYAAESLLPASSVTAATSSDKTVYIEAQQIEAGQNRQMEAKGNVEVQEGNQKFFADHVIYKQDSGDLSADGSVRMEQAGGDVSGPALKMNTGSHIGEMTKPVFELKKTDLNNHNNARGSAALMRSTGPSNYEYVQATYTTCPAGNDDWLLHMSRLDIDRETQIGTAHNAWVEFENVPILYTPWMSFPLDGARHSGVLAPIYGTTSTGGMELTVPVYWNIAPNFDYTVSPRDMSKRGILIQNEFRFKEADSYGEINYDRMPHDHIANIPREHIKFMGTQNIGNGFRSSVKLNRVGDDNYFRDLSVAVADVTQTQLLNEGILSYSGGWLTGSVRAQTFQTLQDAYGSVAIPYQRMPQINLSAQKAFNDTALSMVDEYVDFRHPTLLQGQRLVLYPSVTYALLNDPGFYLKPKLGIHYTQYAMGDNNTTNIPDTTRTLPIMSLDSGMIFERDMTFGEREFVQTVEPRVYYVRIPYQNQDFLPIYDTSQATLGLAQMFTENRFYGNDRVGDADMTTVGLTSRLIDSAGGVERLRVGAAERFYYSMPRVNLATPEVNSKSDILLSIGGKITNTLTFDSFFDYDPNLKFTASGSATVSYRPETGKLLNLGYHFTQDPITPLNDVRQADFSAQWPLLWRWYAISKFSYSLPQNLVTQRIVGLEYNQSCWMLRLVAEQFWYSETSTTNAFFVQLELNDLVAVGTGSLSELRTLIPGYSRLNDPKLNVSPTRSPGQVSP